MDPPNESHWAGTRQHDLTRATNIVVVLDSIHTFDTINPAGAARSQGNQGNDGNDADRDPDPWNAATSGAARSARGLLCRLRRLLRGL